MPGPYKLRSSQRFDIVNVELGEVEEVEEEIVMMDEEENGLSLMNTNLCQAIVDKFGTRLREEVGAIVESLKEDLLSELQSQKSQITALESENIMLRDNQAASNAKITKLEKDVAELSLEVALLNAAPRPPPSAVDREPPAPLPVIDTLVAGDSIVKPVDVSVIGGEDNRLICLPGATAVKVLHEVKKVAKTARIKNLVLHYGTNYIPGQDIASIIREVSDSLHRISHELPDTKIHFSAILPKVCTAASHGISIVNNCLRDLCHIIDIGFIEHPTFEHPSFKHQGVLNEKMYSPHEWKEWRPVHPSHEGARTLSINYKLHLLKYD